MTSWPSLPWKTQVQLPERLGSKGAAEANCRGREMSDGRVKTEARRQGPWP